MRPVTRVTLAVGVTFLLLFAVAGCKEGSSPADIIAKVQAVAKQTCGFIPTAAMVAPILDSLGNTSGAATAAVAAGKVVCDMAVQPVGAQTFFGWGKDNKLEGCWAKDPRCQPDGTLKQ